MTEAITRLHRHSWQPVDLTAIVNGTWTPPQPTIGTRTDGIGLFYPGKTHTVSSETEGGKTWLAMAAVIDELRRGRDVVYFDFEDDEGTIGTRLLALQIPPADILSRFHYIRPIEPLGSGIRNDDLAHEFATHRPSLAVIDGVTEAMGLHGLNPLDNADVAKFGRILPRRLASSGSAVVCMDHVTKDRENRGRYALGGVHKLNGLDGAAYVLENRTAFGIGLTGKSSIKIAKDRIGNLRKHAFPSAGGMHWFGDLVLESHDEDFAEITIAPPHERDQNFRPTRSMEKLWKLVDAKAGTDGLSGRTIQDLAGGNAQSNRTALAHLVVDGYLTKSPHRVLKPYPPESEED